MRLDEGYSDLLMMTNSTDQDDRIIQCQDLFAREFFEQIRVVLTKGVAGVGKTVLTQKFSLDWIEGKSNQEIQLLFHFNFKELNKFSKEGNFTLVELLHRFFSSTKPLFSFQCLKVLFIFDGLDECRLRLNFRRTRVLTEDTEIASVEELLVNLIRGDLLPSALIWITTRPVSASQIPEECIDRVTEIQGFTETQKEQYFKKRIGDEEQATAVISHIKSTRSVFMMCNIPIFCWIISTVLMNKVKELGKFPKTLSQMFIHFLVVQFKIKNIKFDGGSGKERHWTEETKKMVWSLGKLAFEMLQKGNLFSESDLSKYGLDAEIARYSGVITEIFREESGLYMNNFYCFIHQTVQEFLAALHVHQTFFSSGVNLLSIQNSVFYRIAVDPVTRFYRSAVDRALESPNGHLDLFVRFLLGLSLPTNQSLLPDLSPTGSEQINLEIANYIKLKLNRKDLSIEKSLSLLHCLNELNDESLLNELKIYMRKEHLSLLYSPVQWSTLAFSIMSSDSDLEQFDLRKYCPSEKALLNLLPVVKSSAKATLSGCGLTYRCCEPLASVLTESSLTQLDLSNNNIGDTGVMDLCEGLKSATCRLDTLNLSHCGLTYFGCSFVADVLTFTSLTQLDLSNNDFWDWGVEKLSEQLKSDSCKLVTLKLSGCGVSKDGGASLAAALKCSSSHLRHLDLSYNDPGPSAELLTAVLVPHGPLHSLKLDPSGERWMAPGLLKYNSKVSLDPNTAHRCLVLQNNNRSVTREPKEQWYPYHEDRFTNYCQVLCSEGLRGRCYCEASWSGRNIDVAVSYRGISRYSRFGNNDQSWCLEISNGSYSVRHNGKTIDRVGTVYSGYERVGRVNSDYVNPNSYGFGLSSTAIGKFVSQSVGPFSYGRGSFVSDRGERGFSGGGGLLSGSPVRAVHHSVKFCGREAYNPHRVRLLSAGAAMNSGGTRSLSGRVGVFLDFEAGVLSFYEVRPDGNLFHLHTFMSQFTEPLFLGFTLRDELSFVKLFYLI